MSKEKIGSLTENEEKIAVMLCDLANSLETAALNLKHQLSELVKVDEELWDPAKIRWEPAEGTQGPYERSEDVNSLDFKAMHKDLVAHQGTLSRDGYFCWLFRNGTTIGRKQRKQGEGKIG